MAENATHLDYETWQGLAACPQCGEPHTYHVLAPPIPMTVGVWTHPDDDENQSNECRVCGAWLLPPPGAPPLVGRPARPASPPAWDGLLKDGTRYEDASPSEHDWRL